MPSREEIIQALEQELEACKQAGKDRRVKAIEEALAALRGEKKPARSKHEAAEKRG
mgnify:CR=1 FL=1